MGFTLSLCPGRESNLRFSDSKTEVLITESRDYCRVRPRYFHMSAAIALISCPNLILQPLIYRILLRPLWNVQLLGRFIGFLNKGYLFNPIPSIRQHCIVIHRIKGVVYLKRYTLFHVFHIFNRSIISIFNETSTGWTGTLAALNVYGLQLFCTDCRLVVPK